jgi:hypothetical protein
MRRFANSVAAREARIACCVLMAILPGCASAQGAVAFLDLTVKMARLTVPVAQAIVWAAREADEEGPGPARPAHEIEPQRSSSRESTSRQGACPPGHDFRVLCVRATAGRMCFYQTADGRLFDCDDPACSRVPAELASWCAVR